VRVIEHRLMSKARWEGKDVGLRGEGDVRSWGMVDEAWCLGGAWRVRRWRRDEV
jgi:hypothetical protein